MMGFMAKHVLKKVRMYAMDSCPYCHRAEQLLRLKGVPLEKLSVEHAPELYREMVRVSGRRTVPQIFIGDTHIGGYDDLAELDADGKLDGLLRD